MCVVGDGWGEGEGVWDDGVKGCVIGSWGWGCVVVRLWGGGGGGGGGGWCFGGGFGVVIGRVWLVFVWRIGGVWV